MHIIPVLLDKFFGKALYKQSRHPHDQSEDFIAWQGLEPLAEVERALLVVEVLHAPHPELLGLLLRLLGEHLEKEL